MLDSVKKVGVVGAGVMGSAIAGIMAFNGFNVAMVDVTQELVQKGYARIVSDLKRLLDYHNSRPSKEITRIEELGVILTETQKQAILKKTAPTFTEQNVKEILSRLSASAELATLSDSQLVIEAISEDIDLKKRLFKELRSVVDSDTVLATNTSTLSITELAASSGAPNLFLGMHFFNPPVTLPLVEVIPGMLTDPGLIEDAVRFLSNLKNHRGPLQPIVVKEVPGFLVNRILMAMLNEAFSLYEEGVASMRDIDLAMKSGAGMPMGPFELADMIGIDILYNVSNSIRAMEGGNSTPRPIRSIRRMFYAGKWGRKTGEGFYSYK